MHHHIGAFVEIDRCQFNNKYLTSNEQLLIGRLLSRSQLGIFVYAIATRIFLGKMQNIDIENVKNEVEKPAADSKPPKDRRNRKEKAKPLLKVNETKPSIVLTQHRRLRQFHVSHGFACLVYQVVIRRLPPTMTEEEFLEQIEPMPDHDYFYFVSADWTLGQQSSSRAYINFCNFADIFIFKDKFDGYVFLDGRGIEYPAIVEFAPFQGLPKSKSRKKDNKANTIETEQHYLTFVESLKEASEGKGESKMEYTFKIKDGKRSGHRRWHRYP